MPITVRQRTIQNAAKRAASINKGKRKGSGGEYLVTNAPTDLQSIAYPGGVIALILLVTARLLSAYFGQIADCDETYNYWEPLHYLIYGNGLQTWEYSPVYAIRSYMPLWMFAVPAKFLTRFFSPVVIFYMIRALLGILTACAEFMFYKAVCHEFGVNIGRIWLGVAVPAAGVFGCAAAMLPSAWSNGLAAAALACWWRRRYPAAIFFTAVNVLLSWPFTALLGLPIAIDMLINKRKDDEFFKWSLISLLIVLVPTVLVDSWHYGGLVVAPWNIVAYNVFGGNGPNLYGVEPWTYYFVNGFLNFNFVWITALLCPLLLVLSTSVTGEAPRASFCLPYTLSLLPLYAWLAVFMFQPHKEERFLYPVYSMIALAGAISLDCGQKIYFYMCKVVPGLLRKISVKHYVDLTEANMYFYLLVVGVLSVSRTLSLYKNYSGPMTLLQELPLPPTTDEDLTVCFGKEWYRSPSSFHLPEGYNLRFVKSEFNGQLPAPYSRHDNATREIHSYFNDANKEDNSTYLPPSQCHYLVDSDVGTATPLQPNYHKDTNKWEVIASVKILAAEKSIYKLLRAFYIPYYSAQHNVYANLYLLKNKLVS